MLFSALSYTSYAQVPDTLTPEKKVRYRINQIKEKKTDLRSDNAINNALLELTNFASNRIPFVTMKQLRAGKADTSQIVQITDANKEGLFKYNPISIAPDDSAMVIKNGNRRYERIYEYLRPEYFGANSLDNGDDAPAFQKMFNSITKKGADIRLSAGEYIIGSKVDFKSPTGAPAWFYKTTMQGAGMGSTKISGKPGFTGDMFVMNTGKASGKEKDALVKISDIYFSANTAGRILFATEAVSIKIYDCRFDGGEICGIQFGVPGGAPGGYNCQLRNTYHNGGSYGQVAQIPALVKMYSCRFFTIDNFESDGGKYGIMIISGDKNIITRHKIEGTKRAGIFIDNENGGGGENSILYGTINPYAGLEKKALFDGEINGIEINSRMGANSGNSIMGNLMLGPTTSVLPRVFILSKTTGNFDPAAYLETHGVVGQKSGAVGYLEGYDPVLHKAVIQTTKGSFQVGEVIKQRTTNAQGVVNSIGVSHSNAIKLTGVAGYSIIANNRFRVGAEIAINNQQNNNIITGNWIEATAKGIYTTSPEGTTITSNQFSVPSGIAVENTGGSIQYSNNTVLAGTLANIRESYLTNNGGEITGNVTLSGSETNINNLKLTSNAYPSGENYTKDLGSYNNAFRKIVSGTVLGTVFQAINNGVVFAVSNGSHVGRFDNTSGNFILGQGNPKDTGEALQVNGKAWFSKGIKVANQTIAENNAAAVAAGLSVGDFYHTPTGEVRVVVK